MNVSGVNNSPLLSLAALAGIGDKYSTKTEADVDSKIIDPTRNDLHTVLKAPAVQALIGDFSTNVWGPAITVKMNEENWPPDSKHPIAIKGEYRISNLMYITEQEGLYAVLIAGTDPYSRFDWMVEDEDVLTMVEWKYPNTPSAKISQGISKGLDVLTSMTATVNGTGPQISAVQFLQDARNVVVSGHSLGGTLTPVFALYLKNQLPGAKINAAPFAGATPGDAGFVAHYKDVGMEESTVRFVNSNDVVPHAFNLAQLNELYGLYDHPPANIKLDPGSGIGKQLASLISALTSAGLNYEHVGGQVYSFAGKLSSADPFFGIPAYLVEACRQHLNAYIDEFALTDFTNAVDKVLNRTNFFHCPIP